MMTELQIEQIHPNAYNPNQMTDEEFAELVAEIRHLGKLPKPLVVRPAGENQYVIVDGEHNYRAAKELSIETVPCEVVEVDDFEAMRQTYKRNQSGTHNPVKEGQMFERMMDERGLSQNALAKEINVSEGTVRNMLLYAEAARLRNGYEHLTQLDLHSERSVASLSTRELRWYLLLHPHIANLWLDSGGQVDSLWKALDLEPDPKYTEEDPDWIEKKMKIIAKSGLLEFIERPEKPKEFVKSIQQVRDWLSLESFFARGGLTVEQLRPYLQLHYEGRKQVRDRRSIEKLITSLVDVDQDPPTFVLTPAEVESIMEEGPEGDTERYFFDRLELALLESGKNIHHFPKQVRKQLNEREIELEVPEFIKHSQLKSSEDRRRLWKWRERTDLSAIYDWEVIEQAKKQLAQRDQLPERLNEALDRLCKKIVVRQQSQQMSSEELAQDIARRCPLYTPESDGDAIKVLAEHLTQLTRGELFTLWEQTKWWDEGRKFAKEYREALAQKE